MSTSNPNIENLYSWTPDRGQEQENVTHTPPFEPLQPSIEESTNQTVEKGDTEAKENFLQEIKRMREEAHREAIKENKERNRGFTAKKMSSNYLQFVKDQEQLSKEYKEQHDRELSEKTYSVLERDIQYERKQREELQKIVNRLQRRNEKQGKEIEELKDLVNTLVKDIEELKKQLVQIEPKETEQEPPVKPLIEEKTVPIIKAFKNDEHISQWRYEYPEYSKESEDTQQQSVQEEDTLQESKPTPQAPPEIKDIKIEEEKRKRELVLKLTIQASAIIPSSSTDTPSNINE